MSSRTTDGDPTGVVAAAEACLNDPTGEKLKTLFDVVGDDANPSVRPDTTVKAATER